MFIERQKQIIRIFIEKKPSDFSITTSELAKHCKVTSRTIQNDIKAINAKSNQLGFRIQSAAKGLSLLILDEGKSTNYVEQMELQEQTLNFTLKKDRVNYILTALLFSRQPILSDYLANEVAVSRSQLSLDLKEVKRILGKYCLKINTKYHSGICIEGTEQNKRLCIVKEKLNYELYLKYRPFITNRRELTDIVMNTLISEKYIISDLIIQNLIAHIEMSLVRIANCNLLNDDELTDEALTLFAKEMEIASKIYQIISKRYLIKIDRKEIVYLAINLFSKKIYDDKDDTEVDANAFTLVILENVKDKYGIDLTNDIDLQINLALHIVPLVVRARNGLLMNNALLSTIKEKMTLAYDIAVTSGGLIEEQYRVRLNEDECGFLAAHFAVALSNLDSNQEDMKVLVITSTRKSESLLLKYNIQKLFSHLIGSVEVMNISDIQPYFLPDYDVVFTTTELSRVGGYENVLKINYFLTNEDKQNIEKELLRKKECKPLLKYFDKDLFIAHHSYQSKAELLKDLCKRMSDKYQYEENLYESVMYREQLGSTVFADTIALTHPEKLFSNETILGVVILDEPMEWNEIWNEVRIVFLMNVENNKRHELAYLYEFFSEFVQNKKYADRLFQNPTFENFKNIIARFTEQKEEDAL